LGKDRKAGEIAEIKDRNIYIYIIYIIFMDKRRKNLLKQSVDIMFKVNIKEIFDKKISKFGSGSHIVLPARYIDKKAKVIILK
jgi:putative transposon-encoded protein